MNIQKTFYYLSVTLLFLFLFNVGSVHAATTAIRITVKPSRIIVIDEQNQIKQIWSNTGGSVNEYEIFVRKQSAGGILVDYTPAIRKKYQALEQTINWAPAGVVYEKKEQVFISFVKQLEIIIKEFSA